MDAQKQLDGFLDKYVPDTATQARAALAKMKARLPGATMLVYDNYNALVIGFGATDKPSKAVLSLAVFPRHVTLCSSTARACPTRTRCSRARAIRCVRCGWLRPRRSTTDASTP